MNDDALYRFLIEGSRVHGRAVRLDGTWHEVNRRGRYARVEARLLGEAMAATALLSGSLKGDGRLTLQVRGRGPVELLVTQFTAPDGLRGMLQVNGEIEPVPLSALFGQGQLAMTLEPANARERYQGVVDLVGEHFGDALTLYFEQSEQLPTRFWLAVDESRVAGLMLQCLPGEADADPDAWERSLHLAATLGPAELLGIEPMSLLRRLFAGETLRVFDPRPLRFQCACSRERSESMLRGLGQAEVLDVVHEQGSIEIRCEFCNARYLFNAQDVAGLFGSGATH